MSEQLNVKYDKIVMLVHPGYYLTYDYFNSKKLPDIKDLPEAAERILKIFFGVYGKALIEASKDPKTLIVIVEPNFNGIGKVKQYIFYKKLFSRFSLFAKKLLGSRAIFTNYDPVCRDSYSILPESYISVLDKFVDLESFGEYGLACVPTWRAYLESFLNENNIKVLSSKTNLKYSFYSNKKSIKDDSLIIRLQKHARDRRKLRRKFAEPYKGPRLA